MTSVCTDIYRDAQRLPRPRRATKHQNTKAMRNVSRTVAGCVTDPCEHLVEQQQVPVLVRRGVQVVLGRGPAVPAAVVLQQRDGRVDLTGLQRQQAGGGQGGAWEQRQPAALRLF